MQPSSFTTRVTRRAGSAHGCSSDDSALQTIVQLAEDQCIERSEQREREATKKLKQQHEKEIKALTQRCIKDKQALKLEAEADRKAMGLEVARVKKRLIEAEREAHQAACQRAQTQRDARNLRRQLEESHDAMSELKTILRTKDMEITEIDKSQKRYRRDKEEEMQKFNEHVLNLEAKLNNQEALWTDRWMEYIQATETEKERRASGAEERIREAYRNEVQAQLTALDDRIGGMALKEGESCSQMLEVREKLHGGYMKITKIQRLFREGAEEDVAFMKTTLSQMHCWMHMLHQENAKLRQKTHEIEEALSKAGITSIASLQQEIRHIKAELEDAKSHLIKEKSETERLRCQLKSHEESQKGREETIRQLSVQVQNLSHDLEEATESLNKAHQERDISKGTCSELMEQNTRLSDELSRVATQLASVSHHHAQNLQDMHQLTSDLQSLKDHHRQELSHTIHCTNTELLSVIQESTMALFGRCHATMASLNDVLCDATTQSCLRSLKLNSQLRSAGIDRKNVNSSVKCIVSRLNTHIDDVLQNIDLGAALEYLRENDVGNCEVRAALREMESGCFWFMLDAYIRRVISESARSTPSVTSTKEEIPVKGKGLRTWRRARERLRKQHPVDPVDASPDVQKDDVSPRIEAGEIVEIIEVLKEHIKNGKSEA